METIDSFGLAKIDGTSMCPKDQFNDLSLDSYCNVLSMGQELTNFIKKGFEA